MINLEKDISCNYQQNLMSVFTRKSENFSEGLHNQFLILKASKKKTNFFLQKYKMPRKNEVFYILHVKDLAGIDIFSAIEVPNVREKKTYIYLKYTFEVKFTEGVVTTRDKLPEAVSILQNNNAFETPEIFIEKYLGTLEVMKEDAKRRYCENMNVDYEK